MASRRRSELGNHRQTLPKRARAALIEAVRALGAFVLCIIAVAIISGASPAPAQTAPKPATTPNAAAAKPAASGKPAAAKPAAAPAAQTKPSRLDNFPRGQAVIAYLSQVIAWYRHLGIEERFVEEPSEVLIFAEDRRMAGEILTLAFQYARAEAKLLAKLSAPATPPAGAQAVAPASGSVTALPSLEARETQAQQDGNLARQKLKTLQRELVSARGKKRRDVLSAISAAQSEIDLANARYDAIQSMIAFEKSNALGARHKGGDLLAQIDELQRSVALPPSEEAAAKGGGAPAMALKARHIVEPSGIIGLSQNLFALGRKLAALDETIRLTQSLAETGHSLRDPLIKDLVQIRHRGAELASQSGTSDVIHLRSQQREFQALIERHKLVSAATLPVAKQVVALDLYVTNLKRWKQQIEHQSAREFRSLITRLVVLGIVLALVFGAAVTWRRVTFRYVQDVRRRHQFLQARRLVVAIAVAMILLFNFASELGAVATVMGFAAAGIAFALQNVILSVAGYFFMIGKFGIKAGDRVQISGVTGDVVDIGLVKLSLMELGGTDNDHQPTGRVVVFSNAIVFQSNGNFFKQAPGSHFVWREVSLTLSPDCDYRLAEKRLLEATEEVFAHYREAIQRQYREMEKSLNIEVEMPRPQSRLQLGQQGLQMTIRYPVETRNAIQTADAVTRRLLDTIRREPSLKLVGQATPNIQPPATLAEPTASAAPQPPDAPETAVRPGSYK